MDDRVLRIICRCNLVDWRTASVQDLAGVVTLPVGVEHALEDTNGFVADRVDVSSRVEGLTFKLNHSKIQDAEGVRHEDRVLDVALLVLLDLDGGHESCRVDASDCDSFLVCRQPFGWVSAKVIFELVNVFSKKHTEVFNSVQHDFRIYVNPFEQRSLEDFGELWHTALSMHLSCLFTSQLGGRPACFNLS